MIPTIEDIVTAVANGTMPREQALAFLYSHMELERGDLRELFAAQAQSALIAGVNTNRPGWQADVSWKAFILADAILEARKK